MQQNMQASTQTDKKIDIKVTDIFPPIDVVNPLTGSEKTLIPLVTANDSVYKVDKTELASSVVIGSKVTLLASRDYRGQVFYTVVRVNK